MYTGVGSGGKAGPDMTATPAARERALAALDRFGADAVSFQGLESALTWWHDAPAPDGTGAAIAYLDTGRSWIAAGRPLAGEEAGPAAARRFAAAARATGRRPVFFAVESLAPFAGFRRVAIGLQSILEPSRWPATLATHRRLREQLRRARAKGVSVRVVDPAELAPGTPLRAEVERLGAEWLAARAMEPMAFLVAVEPFHAPERHLYVVAERYGQPVQFLSAVPARGSGGWLFEDMLRGADAPNGTTELVLDLALRTIAADAAWATPGLTPLAGGVSWGLRAVRIVSRPLYDFDGLRRFRARLSPSRWIPIWLTWDRGPALFVIADVLRAFAGGRLFGFAWRSLTRHPNGPPWVVAVPLVPWTGLLVGIAARGRADVLGFSTAALSGWIAFDVALATLLFRVARRPRLRWLAGLSHAAGADALVSCRHLALGGLGFDAVAAGLRLAATAGPILGTLGLLWATGLAVRRARRGRRIGA
jgi:phosphatidylglycerol lysyltransferase